MGQNRKKEGQSDKKSIEDKKKNGQEDKMVKNAKNETSSSKKKYKNTEAIKRKEEFVKESSLTPRSKFKFIRQKFENGIGEKIVRISSCDVQPLRKQEKAEQQTPSVVRDRKLAEKGKTKRPFSDHILSNIDVKSDGTKGRPNWKRKFIDPNTIFNGETAQFSPSKRQKIKNCPNFNNFSDRLGSYPVRGTIEVERDENCGQNGDFIPNGENIFSER